MNMKNATSAFLDLLLRKKQNKKTIQPKTTGMQHMQHR